MPEQVSIWQTVSAWQIAVFCGAILLLIGLLIWALIRYRRGLTGEPQEGEMTFQIGKLHEKGSREEQQDSFGISEAVLAETHGTLIVVADGMGGLEDGGRVSAAAVESVLDHFMSCAGELDAKALLLTLAREAVKTVNAQLGPDGYRKSGSTLAMGYIRKDEFMFLSIGDSRICLMRGGELMQLNREHVYEHEQALKAINGGISVDDALADPQGAGLVSFIGMGEIRQFDMPASPLRLLRGDKLILMSDGVYNALSDAELSACLSSSCSEAADQLRTAIESKQYANQDNFTAVLVACV